MNTNLNTEYLCNFCGKIIRSKLSNFNRHLKTYHSVVTNKPYNIKCLEVDCHFTCNTLDNLRNHLQMEHQLTFEMDGLHFENMKGVYKKMFF